MSKHLYHDWIFNPQKSEPGGPRLRLYFCRCCGAYSNTRTRDICPGRK